MTASLTNGLTDAEVAQRVAEGKSNAAPQRATRSIAEIVRANVFTRINAILGVLLVIVLARAIAATLRVARSGRALLLPSATRSATSASVRPRV